MFDDVKPADLLHLQVILLPANLSESWKTNSDSHLPERVPGFLPLHWKQSESSISPKATSDFILHFKLRVNNVVDL